jgi:diguanylate cyclase (GGDEF)-like protein/PAS domain S-box-containing protein
MAREKLPNSYLRQYRLLYENGRDILLFVRFRDGKILEASRSAVKAYQYSRDDLLSKTIFDLRAPNTLSEITPQMAAADSSGILFETFHRRKDGTIFPVEVNSQSSNIGNEKVLLSIVRDITDRSRVEQLLGKERKELQIILDAAPVMIFYKDRDNRIIRVNRARAEAAGLRKEDLEGKNAFEIFPNQAESYWRDDREVIASGKPKTGIIDIIETPNGPRWIRTDKIPYRDEAGNVIGVIGFAVDITELKQMEEALRNMALRDQLTELYNRRGFITLAEQQIKAANRTQKPLLLSYIDVDGMKRVNDTLGHEEGDRVLIHTAHILRQTFRESDIIARIGGDEFAVLSLDVTDMNPEIYSTRLRDNIVIFNALAEHPYKLELSWDTAVYDPQSPVSLDKLLSTADRLMYKRKKGKSDA